MARGHVQLALGKADPHAIADTKKALEVTPISAKESRDIAFHFYVLVLSKSHNQAHNAEALESLQDLRQRFKGQRGNSVPLALVDAMEAGLLARQAEGSHGFDESIPRARSRQLFAAAVEFFEEHKMPLEADTFRSDLAALEAPKSRARAARILDFRPAHPELRPLLAAARRAARGPADEFWPAMRAYRDATVAMGADPPLVPYGELQLADLASEHPGDLDRLLSEH